MTKQQLLQLKQTHRDIVRRTTHPYHDKFNRYGSLGIQPEWLDATTFIKDVLAICGPKPSETHTLNRIDNEIGYYRVHPVTGGLQIEWATPVEQARNRRRPSGKMTGKSVYRGVSPFRGKWKAQIYPSPKKCLYLGLFLDEESAAKAYDATAKLLGFPEMCLNFPDVLQELAVAA